jgi:hypothetical protein
MRETALEEKEWKMKKGVPFASFLALRPFLSFPPDASLAYSPRAGGGDHQRKQKYPIAFPGRIESVTRAA